MKPKSTRKTFLEHLERASHLLTALTPSEGVELMLGFYREERADGCRMDENGDMLLYQWGTYDWGEGESFQFDITRQLIVGDGEDEDFFQLSLTFKFQATPQLRQLGNGNRWCESLAELEEFRAFIYSSPAFLDTRQKVASDIQLKYGPAG